MLEYNAEESCPVACNKANATQNTKQTKKRSSVEARSIITFMMWFAHNVKPTPMSRIILLYMLEAHKYQTPQRHASNCQIQETGKSRTRKRKGWRASSNPNFSFNPPLNLGARARGAAGGQRPPGMSEAAAAPLMGLPPTRTPPRPHTRMGPGCALRVAPVNLERLRCATRLGLQNKTSNHDHD